MNCQSTFLLAIFQPHRWVRRGGFLTVFIAVAACTSQPPAPDWQLSAKSASDRAIQAYFLGDQRVEQAEFTRARAELARTGDASQIGRLELLRCAAQVASLDISPCKAFQVLVQDASDSELAYARYLEGKALPADIPLLPAAQRAAASAPATQALKGFETTNPFATLVGAGVLFVKGEATPALVDVAVQTASQQGWSRPLLAWLGLQRQLAEQAGNLQEAERLQRRMDLVAPATRSAPLTGRVPGIKIK